MAFSDKEMFLYTASDKWIDQAHPKAPKPQFLQLNKTKAAGDSAAQQLTLADELQRREKFPTESLKSLAITWKVLELIVLDAQPMSVVEDEGFLRLLEYLEPRFSLPSRKYFSKTGIQFIIYSTMVSDLYRVSIDTQSPGKGIGTENVGSVHPCTHASPCKSNSWWVCMEEKPSPATWWEAQHRADITKYRVQ